MLVEQLDAPAASVESERQAEQEEECEEDQGEQQESEIDPLADPEEARVLYAALDSFRAVKLTSASQYRHAAHYNVTHVRRQALYALPSTHLALLTAPPFRLDATLRAVDDAIDANADIADAILTAGLACFDIEPNDAVSAAKRYPATPHDLDKARSTIRQLYRDWSAEGEPERTAAFAPLLRALETHLPHDTATVPRHTQKVLVPGAGLGRFVFELCAAGWSVEGNEISYHQILASNYMLNHAPVARVHRLFPWALGFSNHQSRAQQLQAVAVPDIHPGTVAAAADAADAASSVVPFGARMAMTSGDFCVVYRQRAQAAAFAAVATCFFLDTAPNVLRYIDTVRHCLRPGGIWANVGPLLWHFESAPMPAERERARQRDATTAAAAGGTTGARGGDAGIGEPGSFELTADEVLELVQACGFDILEQGESSPTGYVQDPTSMLQNVYRPAFWVARRR